MVMISSRADHASSGQAILLISWQNWRRRVMSRSFLLWECNFYHLLYNRSYVVRRFKATALSIMRILNTISVFGYGCYSQIESDYVHIIPPIIRVIAGPGSRDLISDKPGKAASRSRTGIDPEPPKRYISVADDSIFLSLSPP